MQTFSFSQHTWSQPSDQVGVFNSHSRRVRKISVYDYNKILISKRLLKRSIIQKMSTNLTTELIPTENYAIGFYILFIGDFVILCIQFVVSQYQSRKFCTLSLILFVNTFKKL